jgi:antitoxin FitA
MGSVTIRNLPDEVHRALRLRAARHGRSTEAEIRSILEQATKPEGRVKLGSYLQAAAREAGPLSEEEFAIFNSVRDKSKARAADFE